MSEFETQQPDGSRPEDSFCRKCISKGSYRGPVRAEDFVVDTFEGGDVAAQFVQAGDSGWHYSADQGAKAGSIEAENLAALAPGQILQLGCAVVEAVRTRSGCNRGQNTCAFSAELVDAATVRILGQHEDTIDQAVDATGAAA